MFPLAILHSICAAHPPWTTESEYFVQTLASHISFFGDFEQGDFISISLSFLILITGINYSNDSTCLTFFFCFVLVHCLAHSKQSKHELLLLLFYIRNSFNKYITLYNIFYYITYICLYV